MAARTQTAGGQDRAGRGGPGPGAARAGGGQPRGRAWSRSSKPRNPLLLTLRLQSPRSGHRPLSAVSPARHHTNTSLFSHLRLFLLGGAPLLLFDPPVLAIQSAPRTTPLVFLHPPSLCVFFSRCSIPWHDWACVILLPSAVPCTAPTVSASATTSHPTAYAPSHDTSLFAPSRRPVPDTHPLSPCRRHLCIPPSLIRLSPHCQFPSLPLPHTARPPSSNHLPRSPSLHDT